MMRFLWALAVVALVSTSTAYAANLPYTVKGIAMVPRLKWVVLENHEPMRTSYTTYSFGDTCDIERGGLLREVDNFDPNVWVPMLRNFDDKKLFVMYTAPREPGSRSCPTGVVFLMPKNVFEQLAAEYKGELAAIKILLEQ